MTKGHSLWQSPLLRTEGTSLRREYDFINEEEYHHGYAAIQDGGTDIVDKVRDEQTCDCNPDAVDGINDAGDDTKGKHVPCNLLSGVSVTSEDEELLNQEIDTFT